MHPLVRGASVVAILAAIGSAAPREPHGTRAPAADASAQLMGPARVCPERAVTLENGACVTLPDEPSLRSARARRLGLVPPEEPKVEQQQATSVPLLPDRPKKYADYQMPIDPVIAVGEPLDANERARQPGIKIESDPGAPVHLVDLEHQKDRPEVVLVGQLHAITVIVRHRVEAASGPRDYFAIYGNLARPGPQIVNGKRLGPLAVIGYIADDQERGTHLYFEIRQELVPLGRPPEHLSQLVNPGVSVPVDARNVLPLRK